MRDDTLQMKPDVVNDASSEAFNILTKALLKHCPGCYPVALHRTLLCLHYPLLYSPSGRGLSPIKRLVCWSQLYQEGVWFAQRGEGCGTICLLKIASKSTSLRFSLLWWCTSHTGWSYSMSWDINMFKMSVYYEESIRVPRLQVCNGWKNDFTSALQKSWLWSVNDKDDKPLKSYGA